MSLLHDGVKLARFKLSIGRGHVVPRPMLPIEAADCIEELIQTHSINEISKMIVASPSIVKDIHGMRKTPKEYHNVWGWGTSVGGRISWSRFRRASNFLENGVITKDNFRELVSGVINGNIHTDDVEEILYLKKKNPKKSFEDCYKEISNMRPEIIRSIIFISDINRQIIKQIHEIASSKSITMDEFAADVLRKYLGPKDVEGVLIKNEMHIKIALTENGRKNLGSISKQENILLKDIINHLFVLEGFKNE